MPGIKIIPSNDLEFQEWLENLLTYAKLHYTR